MAGDNTTRLETVLRRAINGVIERRVRLSSPARVVEYDPVTQKATIELELSAPNGETPPRISAAPVRQLRGGGFVLMIPLAAGDAVEVRHADQSLDEWLSNGKKVKPTSKRRFALTDAIVAPGLSPLNDAPAGSATKMIMGREDGSAQVVIDSSEVRLGDDSASELVAFKKDIDDLRTAITGWAPVANDGGAALKTALSGWSPTGATKVKAK